MVLDGLRGYLQLANGLTDVTRSRARAAAAALVAQGESHVAAVLPTPVRAQVASLTDDLVATSRANRDLLVGLVRTEVERSVSRLGLVSSHELGVAALRAQSLERRVAELEADLSSARATASRASSGAARRTSATTSGTRKSGAARKAAAKSPAPAKSVATKRSAGATKKSVATKRSAGARKKSVASKSAGTRRRRSSTGTS